MAQVCINNKQFCKDENCIACFNKSLASIPFTHCIVGIKKEDFRNTWMTTQLKINLKCDTCDNIYNKKISYYIKKIIPFCKICHIPYEKSFASHDKAKYWSDKNELKPFQVYLSTHTKFLFDCPCGHEILMSPNDITDN